MNHEPAHGDGLLERFKRQHSQLEAGEYVIEIQPGRVEPFAKQTAGCFVTLTIIEGPHKGRSLRLRFLADGPPTMMGFVERDLGLLAKWADAVDAAPARDLSGVIKSLWKASHGHRVHLKLLTREDQLGIREYIATGVRVEKAAPEPAPAVTAPPSNGLAVNDDEFPS